MSTSTDPGTYYTQIPILYADCEGMDGSEKVPIGARYKHSDFAPPPKQRARSGSMSAYIWASSQISKEIE